MESAVAELTERLQIFIRVSPAVPYPPLMMDKRRRGQFSFRQTRLAQRVFFHEPLPYLSPRRVIL